MSTPEIEVTRKPRFAKRQNADSWKQSSNIVKAEKQSKPEGKPVHKSNYKKDQNFEVVYTLREDNAVPALFSLLKKGKSWEHYKWFSDIKKAQDCVQIHDARSARHSGLDQYFEYKILDKDGKDLEGKSNSNAG